MKLLVIVLAVLMLGAMTPTDMSEFVYAVQEEGALCAGVAVTYKGHNYIVSCWHCVDRGLPVTVDGQPVELLAFNIPKDIVILSAPKSIKKFTTIKAELPPVGAKVHMWGFPAGNFLYTHGVISGLCKGFGHKQVFAVDGLVWKGNSGGPVFDNDGRVLGIISFGYPEIGTFAFAICGSEITKILDRIKS